MIPISDAKNVILDHCSATWSTDECLSVSNNSDDVTVQWCIIPEGLTRHSYGSIIESSSGGCISFHHNLYAANRSRNPRFSGYPGKPGPVIDFRNNVIANWGDLAGYRIPRHGRLHVAHRLRGGASPARRVTVRREIVRPLLSHRDRQLEHQRCALGRDVSEQARKGLADMSILIGAEIEKALEDGSIKIEPLDRSQVGPGSIDLTLGNDFRVFRKRSKVYHVRNDSRFEDITKSVHVEDGSSLVIRPGEMILGITREKITLADNISGRLEGRSRFARFGLAVHVTAGFMHPGISNHQVLEIVNLGHAPLALYPDTRICQFVFERCDGHAKYQGRFAEQEKP